jgi:hypothetical protein
MPTPLKTSEMLPLDTEVEILRLGPQKTIYNGRTGRVVGYFKNYMQIILDDDPVPRWRNIGVFCLPEEVRSVEFD